MKKVQFFVVGKTTIENRTSKNLIFSEALKIKENDDRIQITPPPGQKLDNYK